MSDSFFLSPDLKAIFHSLPDAYLLLSPGLIIQATTDTYLAATLTKRDQLQGRFIFDVFPDNPQTPEAQGVEMLRRSFHKVLETGQPHEMALQHYDVPDPDRPGQFIERYWLPRNTPVLNEQGKVMHIIHAVVNVTEKVQAERALQQSQAREQAAAAQADLQQQQLQNILMQAPALICIFEGPQHVFQLVNPPYQQLVGERPLLGKPIAEAMPELVGQPIIGLLDEVYRSGESFRAQEMLVQLDHQNTGKNLGQNYYNFIYQAIRSLAGEIEGILVFAYEVTAQVQARRQVEDSQRQVQDLNEELQVSNEELQAINEELMDAQLALRQLNEGLEARVNQRTQEVQKARAEAERQRQRLERLFMQAPAAVCILDGPNLVYELVNPAYQQLFPGRHLLAHPILVVLPEIADNKAYRTFQEVFRTGETHEEQELLIPLARPQDGVLEDRYFNFIQQARYDWRGRIDGVVVFAFEVTGQVKARQASEALAQQLQLLTDALPASIVYVDRKKRYQFANRTALSWRQATEESIIGRTMAEVVGERIYQETAEYIEQVLAGTEVRFEKEINYPTGRRFSHNHLVPNVQGGKVKGFYALVTDITPQMEAQKAVIESERQARLLAADLKVINQQLTRTNVDLDNFIYTASHDLKAPILNIEGLMEALLEQLSPECLQVDSTQLTLNLVLDSVQRFKRTIEHLTEITKLQKENKPVYSSVNLASILGDVQLDLTPLIQATRARVEVDVTRCPVIHFSEKNLRSILYNLLSNAIKYHAPAREPLVRVQCFLEQDYQVLCVQDNGLGIDPGKQHKLFRMFKRLHTHVEGTGLGLYMVKKIIENAGGKIEVESQVGEGSAFKVYFPMQIPTDEPNGTGTGANSEL